MYEFQNTFTLAMIIQLDHTFFYVKLLIIELKQKYEPYICQFFVTIDAKYYLPFSINIDIRILLSVFGVVYRL